MKNITIEQLESLGACNSGLDLFKKYCGNSIEVTEANALKVGRFLDSSWASENLLTESQLETYKEALAPLYKAYMEAEAPLYKAFKEAKAPLYKAYKEALAPLYKAYKEARAPIYKAYEEAEAPLYKAYKEAEANLYKAYMEAEALEFVKAYNNDF